MTKQFEFKPVDRPEAVEVAVTAECTWGEGPDVLIEINESGKCAWGIVSFGGKHSFGVSVEAGRRLAAQILVACDRAEALERGYVRYAEEQNYDALVTKVRGLPPMTSDERVEHGLSFAYGHLASTANHKPVWVAFRTIALDYGWTEERFEKWAAGKEWW